MLATYRRIGVIFLVIGLLLVCALPVMAQANEPPPVEPVDFIKTFSSAAVGGVPIIGLIFFLVEFIKRFKKADGTDAVKGNALLVVSLAMGLIFGGGYMVFAARPPVSLDWWVQYTYWFALAVYGLALGGLTSVGYELVKNMIGRVLTKYYQTGIMPGNG
jgi:hypothetical protein